MDNENTKDTSGDDTDPNKDLQTITGDDVGSVEDLLGNTADVVINDDISSLENITMTAVEVTTDDQVKADIEAQRLAHETDGTLDTQFTHPAGTRSLERAHNEDGTFTADDPSTPDVNEAFVQPGKSTTETGTADKPKSKTQLKKEKATALRLAKAAAKAMTAGPDTEAKGTARAPADPVLVANRPVHPSASTAGPLNPGIVKRLAIMARGKT